MAKVWRVVGIVVFVALTIGPVATLPTPVLAQRAQTLIAQAGIEWPVIDVAYDGATLTVCLSVPVAVLRAERGLGAEQVQDSVRRALTTWPWQILNVQAIDAQTGECRALSGFLPADTLSAQWAGRPHLSPVRDVLQRTEFSRSLAGKTIYVSAGHGWSWNYVFEDWRTQRGVYENLIEDHNNAEAVDQYLIPYLENAGATVIPVRERDWNAARVVVDNDDGPPGYAETGAWAASDSTGYLGRTYRYAMTVAGAATATATWQLDVPESGTYALYAWLRSGTNRAVDAHYRVHHAAGVDDVLLDQRIRPQTWRYLGTFPFTEGTTTVTLDNASALGTGYVVIADAIRLGSGHFDSLDGIVTDATFPPDRPWWETGTFYYSQWMGLDYADWDGFNDVVSRPIFARWNHAGSGEDALYISWHTNGYTGTTSGTESYVYNDTLTRTLGSLELQSAVHDELIHDIVTGWDANWIDRGKKQADLGELRLLWDDNPATQMPGVLLEFAFHDHPVDAQALRDPRFNQLAARAVYQGIVHYFEVRDSVDLVTAPEPPTHLRVQNAGGDSVAVAWSPSPVDAAGLVGEAATGYRVYTSTDGFAWHDPVAAAGTSYSLTGLTEGETVYVRVTAVNDGGESFPTEVLGARVGEPLLLIVNAFDRLDEGQSPVAWDPLVGTSSRMWLSQMNDYDYVTHHGNAVPQVYAWDSASNEAVADDDVVLDDYYVVDWILGEEDASGDGTLNAAERAAIEAYLDSERTLLIGGTNLARDLASRAPAFLQDVLHVGYAADDAASFAVRPADGGAFSGLSDFSFNAPGEYRADAADILTPVGDAVPALWYVGGSGGIAAVQAEAADGCQRVVVTGFPLEVVPSSARAPVMMRVLDYFADCLVARSVILSPKASGYYSVTPLFYGSATGPDLTGVDVQVQRHSDNTFWDGTSWGAETWLIPAGITEWQYALPALVDGGYTVRSQALAEEAQAAPDEVSFTMDATLPLPPTLITPTGAVTLSTPLLTFRWEPLVDTGSPLTYQLAVGQRTFETPETAYTMALQYGTYTWHVRAYDAAGNVGPWSLDATFAMDVKSVYLPLVVR